MQTQGDSELIAKLVGFLLLRKYDHGERIPSERELATRFDVGRGNIREALSYLEALRIIERRAKSGIFMAREAAGIEALAFFAELGIPLDATEVQHTVEMRRIHEIAAIQLACERATLKNFEALRSILQRTEDKIARKEPINEEDRDFHLEIVNATQNTVFHRIVKVFYLMTEKRRLVYFQDPQRCQASHAEHLRIFQALATRDRDAAVNLVHLHLQGVDSYWHDLIDANTLPSRSRSKELPFPILDSKP
jgi:GntR family transcriptional regulator, transcriptional repressor for pyruvate dehydrogenase complex